MQQVKVTSEFFAKSRREYSDWKFAWFREAMQNSLDAGASRININIEADNDLVEVMVVDNGCGMDWTTLTEGFLTLGGSIKPDAGRATTGGFGYAKTLLLFSNPNWMVFTSTSASLEPVIVSGAAGEFSRISGAGKKGYRGTTIQTKMQADGYTASELKAALLGAANKLLMHCYVEGVEINLNGQNWEGFSAETNEDWSGMDIDGVGYLDAASIEGNSSTIWVCKNGLPMFSIDAYGDNGMLAYLDIAEASTEVFTSNRDSLLPGINSKVREVVRELTQTKNIQRHAIETMVMVLNYQSDVDVSYGKDQLGTVGFGGTGESSKINKKANQWGAKIPVKLFPQNFRLEVDAEKLSPAYTFTKTHRAAKLAHYWDLLVRNVFDAVVDKWKLHHCTIKTGFIYSETTEARCSTHHDGTYSITLNPLLLEDDYWYEDLLDLAIHEVAHIRSPYHDEHFVNCLHDGLKLTRRSVDLYEIEKQVKQIFKERKTA